MLQTDIFVIKITYKGYKILLEKRRDLFPTEMYIDAPARHIPTLYKSMII